MFKTQISLSILISLFLLTSCTEESPLISDVDLVVVWAYLYAGEPVTNIKLSSTIPLDTDSSGAPPINNAVVTLIKDDGKNPADYIVDFLTDTQISCIF